VHKLGERVGPGASPGEVTAKRRDPPRGDGLDALYRADQAACDAGDRVGVTADVDDLTHRVLVRPALAQCPYRGAERRPDGTVRLGRVGWRPRRVEHRRPLRTAILGNLGERVIEYGERVGSVERGV